MQPAAGLPPASCSAFGCRGKILFGSGYRLRRLLVLLGWLLIPALLLLGARLHSPLHFVTAAILAAALYPVTARSGEILWEGEKISVRRYLRFIELDASQVEAAVVTPPVFKRQSLVLKLRRPLRLSRFVYCRLAPGTVCDAWALVHERDWEPRGKTAGRR